MFWGMDMKVYIGEKNNILQLGKALYLIVQGY